jgi:hypothetical protein
LPNPLPLNADLVGVEAAPKAEVLAPAPALAKGEAVRAVKGDATEEKAPKLAWGFFGGSVG